MACAQARYSLTDSLGSGPYGTPTSLSIIDRSNRTSFGTATKDGIPDSPPGRANLQSIVDLDDDDTKSESPDLGRSLYDVPLSQAGTPAAGTEMPSTDADDHAVIPAAGAKEFIAENVDEAVPPSSTAPAVSITGSGVPLSQDTKSTPPIVLRTSQPTTVPKDYTGSLSRPEQRSVSSLPRNPLPRISKSGKQLYDTYDPIETDPEDMQKQQDPSDTRRANFRFKGSVQLPPFNNVKGPLTNGKMRPPSVSRDRSQSKVTIIQVDDQPFHPLPENLQRTFENTDLQASTTKIHSLMAPPKIAPSGAIQKHQHPSLESLSQSMEVIGSLGDASVNQGRSAGHASSESVQLKHSITAEEEFQLPENQGPEVSMRSMQQPRKEGQQEQLDRKRKRQEAESPSSTMVELGRGAATLEAKDLVPKAKETGNLPRQSKADGLEVKEKEEAERQRVKEVQIQKQNGSSVAEVNERERIEKKKAKETEAKVQKTKVLENDAKRSKPEQTTKLNGIQDSAKQTEIRSMTPRTTGRSDSEAVKNRRAEQAIQKAQESPVPGRFGSSTPFSSSGTQETKLKLLTAFYPGSGGSRSSSLSIEPPNPLLETPAANAKAGEQPPLTSALRKSPNILRRSVSISWADHITPAVLSKPTRSVATAQSPNGDKRTSLSPITLAKATAPYRRQPSVEITRTSSAASVDASHKKSRDPPKKSTANIKKQTKLNVKRDVKQKGRVFDPPSPPKRVAEEALVISSDGEGTVSTFYSDPDDDVQETCNAKAGPSSKTKAKSDTKLVTGKAVITPKTPPDSQVNVGERATVESAARTVESNTSFQQAKAVMTAKTPPESQGIASHQNSIMRATPSTQSATGSHQSDATNDRSKTSSRSPARYISSSPSSTSGASAKSDASATSSSPPDIAQEPSSQASMKRKSTPLNSSRSSSHNVAAKDVESNPAPPRRLSSVSSTTHSTQHTQTTDAASVKSALDQQLQREARQFSEPAQVQVKSSPPTTRSQASISNSQTKATPAATSSEYQYTMSGPRPANMRFPSLTKLKNNPPKYDPKEHLKHASFMFSRKPDNPKPIASSQPNGLNHDDESSSDSDDESGSSSDDTDDNVTRNPFSSPMGSQLSKKSDGRNARGLSALLNRRFFIHWRSD